MQVFVLGMHRSGTSVVARLLNMAGAYFGPEGTSTGHSEQNPKGFWERRDVRDINDEILRAIDCDWDRLHGFDLSRLEKAPRKSVDRKIGQLVLEMDAHRPWMLKEPRFCLTFPLWRPVLELPVAVVVRRHPLEIAESLRTRNGFPLSLGLALWEIYTIQLLRGLRGMRAAYVDHDRLLSDPIPHFSQLLADLSALGASQLRVPEEREIAAFVDPSLYRSTADGSYSLTKLQRKLWDHFSALKTSDEVTCPFKLSTSSEKEIAAHQNQLKLRNQAEEARRLKDLESSEAEIEALRVEVAKWGEREASDRWKAIRALARYQVDRTERRRLRSALERSEASLQLAAKRKEELERQLAEVREENKRLSDLPKLAETKERILEAEKKKVTGELQAELDMVRKQALDLEKKLAQRDKKIEIMRSGVSWWITAPLRAFGFWWTKRSKPAAKPAKPAPSKESLQQKQKAAPAPALDALEVDIIVCVHNALADVRACLQSVAANRTPVSRIIVVNDGSDAETTEFLETFARETDGVKLLSSPIARGYTKAVNHGVSESKAPYVILLNSDTIVAPRWVEKLLKCALSDPKLGIVGPLSNAATWQSVPAVKSARGQWAVNSLPPGRSVADMDTLVAQMSGRRYPRVPLLNGFCLLIKKEVFDKIGIFDEAAFPRGYGEENDFCLRAAGEGYKLAVADDCYIFHAKSKSYTDVVRNELVEVTKRTLEERYGAKTLKSASAQLQNNAELARLRARLEAALDRRPAWPVSFSDASLRVLFILPCMGKGGGVLSILQESYGMVLRGVEARVAVYARHLPQYLEHFSDYPAELFVPFRAETDLAEIAGRFNVVVGTVYASIALLREMVVRWPAILPAYYIQDYEPFFFDAGSEEHRNARASYNAIPGMVSFAKTKWICQTVLEREGVVVEKVQASVDHSVFYPLAHREKHDGVLEICAMIRPQTPRRAARETVDVLRILKRRLGDRVRITGFGCEIGNPALEKLKIDFELINRGVLSRSEVASLLRNSDLFIDMSTYQAFGRTAVEAMASGCAAVVPANSGADEFAVHLENAMVIDTSQIERAADQIEALLRDPALLAKLKRNGARTAMHFTVQEAVYTILDLFSRNLRKRAAEI